MTDEKDKAPEQPAVEQSPENVPAPTGEVHQVGVRAGMFGVAGNGDTSGYGGLVAAVVFPAPAQRPFGGWYDEVADALDAGLQSAGLDNAIESVVIHRGEITFHVRREDLVATALMHAAARYVAFATAAGADTGADFATERDEAIEHFSAQFRDVVTQHYDDYAGNFKAYLGRD